MWHLSILQVLTWYTKDLLTRLRYHIMGNPNDGLLFNSADSGSRRAHVAFTVSGACGNRVVYFADNVFVTYVEWRKRCAFPYHEFLVFHVKERRSDGQPPRVSFITVDRFIGDRKPDPDQNSDEESDQKPEPTPDAELDLGPLLNFTENGNPTLSPHVPEFKAIPAFLQSSQSVQAWSFPSSQQPAGDRICFSLDGTDAFVRERKKDDYACRTLHIRGDYVSVTEIAVLARTIHEFHINYDSWCYQCYWFAGTMYNTIKLSIDMSTSTPQMPRGDPLAYDDEDHTPRVPAGNFRWKSSKVMVTQENLQAQAVIYRRFMAALESKKTAIAEERRKNKGVSC